ncbi:MAG TPA: phosphopantetheine-binding protein [Marmoricola sp.]|jgi:acyl carrier protein|nr:phosphopantetheine-binding protein [Marmoricola sp.]
MSTRREQADSILRAFLSRADKDATVPPQTSLYADGLGLDSLELAELSAMLEDALGSDPFSEGLMPETVGEMLDYFEVAEAV